MLENSYYVPSGYVLQKFSGTSERDLIDRIGALRWQVWQRTGFDLEVDVPDEHWFDDRDSLSDHLAVLSVDGTLIAATRVEWCDDISHLKQAHWVRRLTQRPISPIGVISCLVVDQEYQGQGFGYYLDSRCIEIARSRGVQTVLCDVPEYRIEGLLRRGFKLLQQPEAATDSANVCWAAMAMEL